MPSDTYRDLIRDLARLTGLADDFEQIHRTGALALGGVSLAIAQGEPTGSLVHIHIDFGDVPPVNETAVFRRLLEINLLVGAEGSPRLALDSASGRVIFAYVHPLHGLTPEKLLGGIAAGVRQAQVWRETFFLDDSLPSNLSPAGLSSIDLRHALHV